MADILVGRGVRRRAPTIFDLIQGPATAAQSALGAMGSAAKGAAQATVGLPGDVESLVRMITGGEQTLPTTEQVGQFVNQYIRAPYPQYERLGEFTGLPTAGALTRPATQLTNEATDALVRAITGNPQATAPQVIRETSMPFMQAVAPRTPGLLDAGRESFVPGVEAGKELIVHHNISADKLRRVEKIGGMPVPSIAVSNVENPLTGFGEISLIGNPSMANPSAKNPVFGFDAYTKRTPSISYQIDNKSSKALQNILSDVASEIPGGSYKVDKLISGWEDRRYSDVLRAKFLKDKGYGLPDREMYPQEWQFNSEVNRRTADLEGEFSDWLRNFEESLPEKGVNIKEKIFKGFTYSGNRRYSEVTLENLVKEMKGGAGEEGFNYGVGNLRAVATPKFKKFADIKAARDKIVPQEEMAGIKDEVDKAFMSLRERVGKLENQEGYRFEPEDVLYEVGATRNINTLDKYVKDAPKDLRADIGLFMQKLRELPTEYFEIKPQRAVSVSEFEGAIVPSNAPKSSVDYLRNQGIERIYFYSTPEERKALFKQFGDKMFAATPAIPAAGLLGRDEEQ